VVPGATRRCSPRLRSPSPPISTNREGHGTPEDVGAKVGRRAVSRTPGDGDAEGARQYIDALPYSTGKVGIFRHLLRRPQTFLVGCSTTGLTLRLECWGASGQAKEELTAKQPTAIDLTANLSCPLLGLFGNDDQAPLQLR